MDVLIVPLMRKSYGLEAKCVNVFFLYVQIYLVWLKYSVWILDIGLRCYVLTILPWNVSLLFWARIL